MGAIFCSYIFSNKTSRVRESILNSNLDMLKQEFSLSEKKAAPASSPSFSHSSASPKKTSSMKWSSINKNSVTITTTEAKVEPRTATASAVSDVFRQQVEDVDMDGEIAKKTPIRPSDDLINETIDTYGNTPVWYLYGLIFSNLFTRQKCFLIFFLIFGSFIIEAYKRNISRILKFPSYFIG
jgi:hypothetical protein